MTYHQVDKSDALLLVRAMGLLLNQAAVYGPVHNVTKSAISRVYEEIFENLSRYKALEFTVKSNLICVNGQSGGVDSVVSSNLVRRFAQLDISGLLFLHPLPAKEFEMCVKILAMPIAQVAEAFGVEEILKREGLLSVFVVNVDYKRVEGDLEEDNSDSGVFNLNGHSGNSPEVIPSGIIDISQELGEGAELSFDIFGPDDHQGESLARERRERLRQSESLAALLRETAEALEGNSSESSEAHFERVVSALEHIKSALAVMTEGSETAITSLAQQVNADKETVAGIEAEAKVRGYALNLTREDLLTRYAELNQEIVQPLTVSTGVIEMLRKEQAGIVNESQQVLLKMAHESIERVNQLVNYMHGISGLPESLNPDMDLIDESYEAERFKSLFGETTKS